MKQELQIIPSLHPLRETAAWLLPGDDIDRWLRIVAESGQSFESMEMWVLPRSARDLTPAGVLLTGYNGDSRPSPDAQAYGTMGGRLYLPTHARLDPEVAESEIAELLTTPTAIFHPIIGLIGFTETDVLRPLMLLEAAGHRASSWTMPESAARINHRLRSIEPLEQLSLEQLDEEMGEGIGDKPLTELPPLPGEPKPGALSKARSRGRDGVARLVGWITSKAPSGSAKPTWVDALEQWAQQNRTRPGQVDQEKRNHELDRLLDMLNRSPAEGLSHAIPLSGLSQARGIAPAGNRLTRRGTSFSLSGLFGSGPADPWAIAEEQRRALMESYRQIATEEAQQGRYRRAAYIYGSLLGDLEASERVLEEGGYFEEAAVILRDKLKQPVAAARCLERGGRLGEAVTLYLESNEWLAAAAIYERLEQIDSAHRWYRHTAEQKIQISDFVGAASLLEDKLQDVAEAERVLLLGALPPARDPKCLKNLFELTGRHGRHDQAREALDRLVNDADRPVVAGQLAQSLAQTRGTYPDPLLRDRMAGAVMGLVGRHLPDERSVALATAFTNAIRALSPEDSLLARDAGRHLQRLREAPPASQKLRSSSRSANHVAELVEIIKLPQGVWHRALIIEKSLFALGDIGHPSTNLVVARVKKWNNETTVTHSRVAPSTWQDRDEFESTVVTSVVPHTTPNRHQILVTALGKPPIANKLCSMHQAPPYVAVGTPTPWPKHTLAVSGDVPNITWVLAGTLADEPELVLNAYRANNLTQSLSVSITPQAREVIAEQAISPRIRLHARREVVVLTIGRVLMHFADGDQVSTEILDAPVTQITGAVPFGRSRYALLHDRGLTMFWNYPGNRMSETVCRNTVQPVGAFTNTSGLLVVADTEGGCLYSTTKGQVDIVDRFSWTRESSSPPVAICAIDHGDDFAVLLENGTVLSYTVSAPLGGRR
ncbi:MAG: hypothetical protein AAF333_10550 [Planctomycetota bacterium]